MQRALTLFFVCLLSAVAAAQPSTVPQAGSAPVLRHTVNFEAQHGEAFTVFLDGNEINRMPQGYVTINDLASKTHEVVVVLRRPASKAAVLHLRPAEARIKVSVTYNQASDCLVLYTPSANLADVPARAVAGSMVDQGSVSASQPAAGAPAVDLPPVRPATDDDVTVMATNMQRQPFDSDRLALGKVYVASASFTAAQIARLVEVLNFSDSQVALLKYAYPYCSDRANYAAAIEVLPLNADRKKVLDYIAVQR